MSFEVEKNSVSPESLGGEGFPKRESVEFGTTKTEGPGEEGITRRKFLKLGVKVAFGVVAAALGFDPRKVAKAALNPYADGGPTGGGRPPKEGEGGEDRSSSDNDSQAKTEGEKVSTEIEVREDEGIVVMSVKDYEGKIQELRFPIFEGTEVKVVPEIGAIFYLEPENGEVLGVGYSVEIVDLERGIFIEDERGNIVDVRGEPFPIVAFNPEVFVNSREGFEEIKNQFNFELKPDSPIDEGVREARVPFPLFFPPEKGVRWVFINIPYKGGTMSVLAAKSEGEVGEELYVFPICDFKNGELNLGDISLRAVYGNQGEAFFFPFDRKGERDRRLRYTLVVRGEAQLLRDGGKKIVGKVEPLSEFPSIIVKKGAEEVLPPGFRVPVGAFASLYYMSASNRGVGTTNTPVTRVSRFSSHGLEFIASLMDPEVASGLLENRE